MSTTTLSKISIEDFQQIYRELDPGIKQMVRNVAVMELRQSGCEEIGSSDVFCQTYGLYTSLGSFVEIVKYGLDLIRSQH